MQNINAVSVKYLYKYKFHKYYVYFKGKRLYFLFILTHIIFVTCIGSVESYSMTSYYTIDNIVLVN